jgi:hypothetical protein
MAKKAEKTPAITVEAYPGESDEDAVARFALTPTLHAAMLLAKLIQIGEDKLDLNALVKELRAQSAAASRGDLSRAEAMLVTQAHTLDMVFTDLALRSKQNMGQHLDAADRFMRLALKAQSQCRATLETLANVKNPPVVYARQANIAHGHQQVNNGMLNDARTPENGTKPSKLLEQERGERLDGGTAGETVGSDPAMAAVGAVHRPEDGRG